jgi:hypothetical protein
MVFENEVDKMMVKGASAFDTFSISVNSVIQILQQIGHIQNAAYLITDAASAVGTLLFQVNSRRQQSLSST